ncbi:MAG: P-loop NTPase fold protein [Fusobacteriaceae bacterium]
MEWISRKIMKMIISITLGVIFNKVFTSVNSLKIGENKIMEYEIPFVYTLGINEISGILLTIALIFLVVYLYNIKSESNKKEIAKIYKIILDLELLLFSFIIGTQFIIGNKMNFHFFLKRNDFTVIYQLYWIYISIILHSSDYSSLKVKNVNDLYSSRKVYLDSIEEYLKNMKAFSIVGSWGIGKTKLIENFFYGDSLKRNYELLYIDASIYSDNEKIVESIEKSLDLLFRKYKIFKKNKSFINELFIQNSSILKSIYLSIFHKESADEQKKNIEIKINEIKKTVVICLDNLERINSKERITNFFAILEEIIPENIKRVYVYDEKEMEKIFNNNFVSYIEKYTFNKIELNDISVEEVLKSNKELKNHIQDFILKIENKNKIVMLKKFIDGYIGNHIEQKEVFISEILENDFSKKCIEINNKLKNPRYLNNLKNYLKNYLKETDSEELKYKFEYKLIRDCLQTLKVKDIKGRYIFRANFLEKLTVKKDLSLNKLTPKELDELFYIYFFKVDDEGNSLDDVVKKEIYYERYFENKDINNTDFIKEIELLISNPKENLLEILQKLFIFKDEKYIKKCIEKIKQSLVDEEYTISNTNDLERFFFMYKNYKFYKDIFPKLRINKLGTLNDNSASESLDSFREHLVKNFIKRNPYMQNLRQLKIKCLVQNLNTSDEGSLPKSFKFVEELDLKADKLEMVNALEEIVGENKDILKIIESYDITLEIINFLRAILNLELVEEKIKERIEEVSDDFFIFKNTAEIIDSLKIKDEKFIIDLKEVEKYIEIPNDEKIINEYIDMLKIKLKDDKIKAGIKTLIIELNKYKNGFYNNK